MKKVEIYDQYKAVYSDPNDPDTLLHPSQADITEIGQNLEEYEAYGLVASLYESSKTVGESYTDINVNISRGYAELRINFEDGKILTRVIYTNDQ